MKAWAPLARPKDPAQHLNNHGRPCGVEKEQVIGADAREPGSNGDDEKQHAERRRVVVEAIARRFPPPESISTALGPNSEIAGQPLPQSLKGEELSRQDNRSLAAHQNSTYEGRGSLQLAGQHKHVVGAHREDGNSRVPSLWQ